jgi:hypothetical protein
MYQENQVARIALAIHQTPDQAELTIDTISYIFNQLKQRGYSHDKVCAMILEAAMDTPPADPDIEFIYFWLKANKVPS